MLVFIIYIEPLFLYIERVTYGVALRAPVLGGPRNVSSVAVRENLQGFVDDAEVFITRNEDFQIVDNAVALFECQRRYLEHIK